MGNFRNWLSDERPYLIDPTQKADAALISFNSFGKVTPSVPKRFTWEVERVEASVKYYHLEHTPLKTARKKNGKLVKELSTRLSCCAQRQIDHFMMTVQLNF